jgi:hypothetical protein
MRRMQRDSAMPTSGLTRSSELCHVLKRPVSMDAPALSRRPYRLPPVVEPVQEPVPTRWRDGRLEATVPRSASAVPTPRVHDCGQSTWGTQCSGVWSCPRGLNGSLDATSVRPSSRSQSPADAGARSSHTCRRGTYDGAHRSRVSWGFEQLMRSAPGRSELQRRQYRHGQVMETPPWLVTNRAHAVRWWVSSNRPTPCPSGAEQAAVRGCYSASSVGTWLRIEEGLAVNLHRVARAALVGPLMITGGVLVLTLGSANVLAASGQSANATTHSSAAANLPQSSSRKHDHDRLECSPGRVPLKHGQCAVTFTDKGAGDYSVGQKVCFSVSPAKAGSVGTGAGNCAFVKSNQKALGTFTTSGRYCGTARIIATEPSENNQTHHTTITIICPPPAATTTSAVIPAGTPLPPTGGGWLLGVMGVGVALVTAYAVRTRRWFAPWRLAADQSA